MAWVDVDVEGLARRWHRTSRAQAYLLDLSFGVRFTARQQKAVRDHFRVGEPLPGKAEPLAAVVGKPGTPCSHWMDAEGVTHDLWYFTKTGVVAVTSDRSNRIKAVECAVGMQAYELLVEAARVAGALPSD